MFAGFVASLGPPHRLQDSSPAAEGVAGAVHTLQSVVLLCKFEDVHLASSAGIERCKMFGDWGSRPSRHCRSSCRGGASSIARPSHCGSYRRGYTSTDDIRANALSAIVGAWSTILQATPQNWQKSASGSATTTP